MTEKNKQAGESLDSVKSNLESQFEGLQISNIFIDEIVGSERIATAWFELPGEDTERLLRDFPEREPLGCRVRNGSYKKTVFDPDASIFRGCGWNRNKPDYYEVACPRYGIVNFEPETNYDSTTERFYKEFPLESRVEPKTGQMLLDLQNEEKTLVRACLGYFIKLSDKIKSKKKLPIILNSL